MGDFKEEWNIESAMEILHHPTVDSKIWSEAVEWLLVHGPPQVRELLQQAADHAITVNFPELKAEGYTPDGQPVYNIADIASSLGITEEEAAEMVAEKEKKHGLRQLFARDEATRLQ